MAVNRTLPKSCHFSGRFSAENRVKVEFQNNFKPVLRFLKFSYFCGLFPGNFDFWLSTFSLNHWHLHSFVLFAAFKNIPFCWLLGTFSEIFVFDVISDNFSFLAFWKIHFKFELGPVILYGFPCKLHFA